ncbi:MAG: hypothetical protein EBR02_05945 [Alphaproteobacteria bacterium]|nr:hypothetical protein [Alphaproteobacteria bacterium]
METKASDIKTSAVADAKNDPPYATGVAEFLRQYTPAHKNENFDLLQGRWRVNLGAPINELKTGSAMAYAAEDTKEKSAPLFALVCSKTTPQRIAVLEKLKNVRHPNLLALVAFGPVEFSTSKEEQFIIIYERPAGQRLSKLLAAQTQTVNDYFIRERILTPLSAALQQLSDIGVAHGSINPDTIYFGTQPILGDFASEPCGLSQPFYFEPIERMQAAAHAKGEGSGNQDFYALAVLTIYIMFGPEHFAPFTPENMPRLILRDGALPMVTRNRDYPEVFYEFFRGMLGQQGEDRWNNKSLKPWLEGKRFNMLSMPAITESNKTFDVGKYPIHSKRELAHMLHTHWDDIIEPLQNGQLAHWVALYLRSKELSDNLIKVARTLESPPAKQGESQVHELLARTILQFDPHGPIRFKQLSMHVDGIGPLCAYFIEKNMQSDLQTLSRFISFSMVDFWTEAQRQYESTKMRGREYVMPNNIRNVITQLDRLRQSIRNTGLGFGVERMLYDLNPNMPCLSPMVSRWHITTVAELLRRLDQIAPTLSANDDPIDRHIAAFICSKLTINQEIRLHGLEHSPILASNRSLIALHLLAKAQSKAGNIKLPGLTHWLTLRILPAMDIMRSKSMRNRIKNAMTKEAHSGHLDQMADTLTSTDYITPDLQGFQSAKKRFAYNIKRIAYYKDERTLEYDSAVLGVRAAKFTAYLAFTISVIVMLRG